MAPRPPFHLVLLTQELTRTRLLQEALHRISPDLVAKIRITGLSPSEVRNQPSILESVLSEADVLVLSHVFLEEDCETLVRGLSTYLASDTHLLVMNSLRPLLLRTRLGDFTMARAAEIFRDKMGGHRPSVPLERGTKPKNAPPSPLKFLMEGGDLTEGIKTLRESLPTLLKSLPDPDSDFASYLKACLYWNEPTPENLAGFVTMLADRYGKEPGKYAGRYGPPCLHPSSGIYHPKIGITEDFSALPGLGQPDENRGNRVLLLLMRGTVLAEDTAGIDAIIRDFETRDLCVVPVFSESFDYREAVERYGDPAGISAIVSLSGFPLVGGHNRCEPDAVREFLASRNVLYLTSPSLLIQDVDEWRKSALGLSPMEVAMEVSIHELEGGIEPIVTHGPTSSSTGNKDEESSAPRMAIPDRVGRLLDRLESWLNLRKKKNAEKKILLTIFSFPPGKGSVGTAAYLDVMRSAHRILQTLKQDGYDVEIPESPEALLSRIVTGDDPLAPYATADLAVGDKLTVAEYERIAPEWRLATKLFGPPPGDLNSDGRHILIHGVRLGKVFIGVQPSFGYEGDPMRLLFATGATPHHGFIGYYKWASRVFDADAMIHLGTHGALEFMPGKQAGLSSECWPDILAGPIPNIYLYSVNNPSEGTIAKRRGTAVTIGHLSPPVELAGLYRELSSMKEMIGEYREADDNHRKVRVAEVLIETAKKVHLDRDVLLPTSLDLEDLDRFVGRVYVALMEIESRRIPVGLHTIGRTAGKEERLELLSAVAEHNRPEEGIPSFPHLVLKARALSDVEMEKKAREGDPAAVETLSHLSQNLLGVTEVLVTSGVEEAKVVFRKIEERVDARGVSTLLSYLQEMNDNLDICNELDPLLSALRGGYIPPGPGGDPVRSPAVVPTGRNLHALDPSSVPSAAAQRQGEHVVHLLLERRKRELGHYPRCIGMVLWGLDNIKTHGEGLAQAFYLLGVRPIRNSIGRMASLQVIPLEELGRPRIDVVMNTSGIFRDVFGLQMSLLDDAVRLVASLDEPEELNFVRARAEKLVREEGLTREQSATRVFSNAPGMYGANVDTMVNLSSWKERADLAALYERRKGFSFGRTMAGEEAQEVLSALAGSIDTTFQNLDSSEVSITDVDHYFEYLGGLTSLVEAKSGERPDVMVADTTTSRAKVRSLKETLHLEVRTKLLNPKWFEGMLSHGYQGVEEIRKRFDYTFGWSATCDAVEEWIYRDVHRTYLEDEEVLSRMKEANVHSLQGMVSRLSEASVRGFWNPSKEEQARLEELADEMEDSLEGVAPRPR